jgi:2-polyprenyl-6-methoxyphenol hydroxylase-like FAD-dependent oxidoreductase
MVRSEEHVDVAIVGCGPVGMVLAILLGQQGQRVAILEKFPDRYSRPRAVHVDGNTAAVLDACGVGPGFAAISEPVMVYEFRNAEGLVLLRLDNEGQMVGNWPASNMMHQPDLEDLFEARIAELPTVTLTRNAEVLTLEQSDDRVDIGYRHDGMDKSCQARFAVGCDGANSTVRSLLGTTIHDLGFFFDWLILDLILHEEQVFDPPNLQICDPKRPTSVVLGGPGRRRWEFMKLPEETIEELNTEQRAWELLQPWNLTSANATMERHTVYTFQARWAEQWRSGRVLLAGDAAHQMPPFAGQGMCSGIRDAALLAPMLGAVLRGEQAIDSLDGYQTERLPNIEGIIALSMDLGKIICITDPAEAAERDRAMSANI